MPNRINKNSVSLAGEFAVLSQLALRGYDANMTLGNTKGVDILVSDPVANKMYQLEVKTNYQNSRNRPSNSKIHGKAISGWVMSKKHESIISPNLFYCFVNISKDTEEFKFYIVSSKVVARYVKEQHELYQRKKKKVGATESKNNFRIFRIGIKGESYSVRTPTQERYENNWNFKK